VPFFRTFFETVKLNWMRIFRNARLAVG
jgi:hypothetical protein